MSVSVVAFSLKDAPALIERLLPVQKLSAEAYKEQMANQGKSLNALGSYWKGRKPLILAKACILGSLLPATRDAAQDLKIFELLMAMDSESFVVRWKGRAKPKQIVGKLSIARITDYFTVQPEGALPISGPVDWSIPDYENVKIAWRQDVKELERRQLEVQMLPKAPYRDWVYQANRPEEVMETVHDHIWCLVNRHLGTSADSFSTLVEQLGIMRFGHKPRIADTFCGSGQIPFEAARLGCDVHASDLNPIACMLTWGAFNIVGGSRENRARLLHEQQEMLRTVQREIDEIDAETDQDGWRPKAFLYCLEVPCSQSGWMVPLIHSLIVSIGRRVVAKLVPDSGGRRYHIEISSGATEAEIAAAHLGTLGREGKYGEAFFHHSVSHVLYKTKISTLRGDFQKPDGTFGNQLRLWDKEDFTARSYDLLKERLYCIQWMRPKKNRKGFDYEFRAVTENDLTRESVVEAFIRANIFGWQ